jgi:hypothetical protein
MAQPVQTLPVRFTNGVNTKDDELVQQKLLRLENAVYDRPGSVRKRPGFARSTGGRTNRLERVGNELVSLSDTGISTRAVAPSPLWVSKSNARLSGAASARTINQTKTALSSSGYVYGADVAAIGNLVLAVWSTQADLFFSLVDDITGAQYLSAAPVSVAGSPSWGQVRVSAEGTNFVVRAIDFQGGRSAYTWTISTVSVPTTIPVPSVVAGFALVNSADVFYTGSQPAFVYTTSASLFFGNAGWATTGTLAVANLVSSALCLSGTTRHIAYTTFSAGNSTVNLVGYNATFGAQTYAPVVVESLTGKRVCNVTCCVFQGSLVVVAYDVISITGQPTEAVETRVAWYDTAGGVVQAASLLANSCTIASKINGDFESPFLWLVYSDVSTPLNAGQPPSGSTLLLTQANLGTSPTVVARAQQELASAVTNFNGATLNPPSFFYLIDSPNQVFNLYTMHPAQFGIEPSSGNATYAQQVIKFAVPFADLSIASARLSQSLAVNGSSLHLYDSAGIVEQGFHTPPRVVQSASATSGGFLSNGTYLVSAVYSYTDANGELTLSRPATTLVVALAGGGSTQTFTVKARVPAVTLRQRAAVGVTLYVSELGGQTMYQYGATLLASAADANGYLTVVVTTVVGITAFPSLYTTGGTLRNDPLPPSNFLARAGDRLWGHAGQGVLWYSKRRVIGRSPEFSAFLTYQLSSFNDPTALVEFSGNRIVVFSETQIAAFDGEGLSATGSGNAFTDDELVSREFGCRNQRSVCRFDGGALFKSSKGWFLLSESLTTSYMGADVEAYNGFDVASTELDPVTNKIYVVLVGAGAPVLVFDTYTRSWSVNFVSAGTTPTLRDAKPWRGRIALLDSSGALWEQSSSLFTDNGVAVTTRLRTGWIAPAGLQGFWYVKKIAALGQKKSDHRMVVVARYDYSETIVETFTFDAGSGVAVGPYAWNMKPKRQQCRAISLEVYDDFSGYTAGEGFSLSEIAFEIATEAGLARLSAAQTVRGV